MRSERNVTVRMYGLEQVAASGSGSVQPIRTNRFDNAMIMSRKRDGNDKQ